MFIREVVKKGKGTKYVQHHLVESIRTLAGPRQNMVLNLGALSLQKDKWKALANLIESNLLDFNGVVCFSCRSWVKYLIASLITWRGYRSIR